MEGTWRTARNHRNNPTEQIDPRNLAMPQLGDMRVVFFFGSKVVRVFLGIPQVGWGKNTKADSDSWAPHSTSAGHVGFRGVSDRNRVGSNEVIDKDKGKSCRRALDPCETDSAFVK
jgi:hypothetical protein